MPWLILMVLLSVASTSLSINRPVYKIVLKQKGYAQFLQYDIETPPLREFTLCTWIRVYDLSGDQSIFTYVANGNNRVVRLWLDSGGKHINVSINGKVSSSTAVDITKDVWRHICLSYQADFGAWALYVDSRLVSCQASQSIYGFVLPSGGSVIIGYGTADGGAPNGLEGEVFGTNMILVSTIERNHTIRNDPLYKQKGFHKNKMKTNSPHMNYIVLHDLQTGELKNNFETTQLPSFTNESKSFIKFRTPHSYIDHAVGLDLSSSRKPTVDVSTDKDYLGYLGTDKPESTTGDFWNLNKNEHTGRYNIPNKNKSYPHSNNVKAPLMLSEYETPPPAPTYTFFEKTLEMEKEFPDVTIKFNMPTTESGKSTIGKKYVEELSEIETPPPVEKNTKVYGQWTSSKFAGSVLNYLKNIQLRSREQKKVPQTIPLAKISDSFPYASDFKVTKVRAPSEFKRRNLVEKQFETSKRSPQINLQILEDDIRSNILKSHALTQPKHVEITNRGVRKKNKDSRFYRNVDSIDSNESFESTETVHSPKPFSLSPKIKPKNTADATLQTNNLLSILPFLKSLEYFVENAQFSDTQKSDENNDMYTKSLSTRNKWHNVKSYSNDYTPREIKLEPEDGQSNIEEKIAQVNKRHPAVRLNYKHENPKLFQFKEDPSLVKGRELAMEVSNQSDYNKDSISILKYNHGFLPGHNKKMKMADKFKGAMKSKGSFRKNNFNKHVKIGNALNERHVIGVNEEQNKRSFVGGNENIPDINKYRSDIDNDNNDIVVPGSLGPRICKNLELYDRVLYVQPDESIDMTHILSPVRLKNIGIEFIMQNYKKCSLQESDLQNNPMLFIDWSKTPVRLFGGSFPKTTTDLCGFFKK